MTGVLPDSVSAHLKSFEPGRVLDDYGTAIIRLDNGGLASVTASQISHGRENDLFIEIDGTKGALEWHQEEPNKLLMRTMRVRLPAGYPADTPRLSLKRSPMSIVRRMTI
jgi:predicted dehydrogenase